MIRHRLLLAALAALSAAACATPQYGIYAGPADAPPPEQEPVPPPPGMAPIPNPGAATGDPQPRAAPTTRVAQAELPPVAGAGSPPLRPAATPVRSTPAATAARPSSYRVRQGDTLFSVSRQFELHPQALADANDMNFQTILRTGQTLSIPGGTADLDQTPRVLAQAATPAPLPAPPPNRPAATSTPVRTTPTPAAPLPTAPPTRPAPGQIVPTTPPPAATDVATRGRGVFQWPLSGPVLTRFGATGVGQRNDGVNIGATAGAPVRASAAGEVAYTGNSVPGFGNLILIRHPGGWVTAYGHLQASTVRMQQTVAQGEQIGAAGQTGAVTQPQLHFEIRYAPSARDRARPVDPLTLLPPAA